MPRRARQRQREYVRPSVRPSVRSFVRPSVCSFVRSFVHSLLRVFVHFERDLHANDVEVDGIPRLFVARDPRRQVAWRGGVPHVPGPSPNLQVDGII